MAGKLYKLWWAAILIVSALLAVFSDGGLAFALLLGGVIGHILEEVWS